MPYTQYTNVEELINRLDFAFKDGIKLFSYQETSHHAETNNG
jgi:hypothetical protein